MLRRSLIGIIRTASRGMASKPQQSSAKSVLQKDFEMKENIVPPDEDEEREKELTRKSPRQIKIEEDRESLKWYKEFEEEDNKRWKSKFSLFMKTQNSMDTLIWMQQPWNFSPKHLKAKWENFKHEKEAYLQRYMEDRVKALGPDLAVAHFILYRHGKIK